MSENVTPPTDAEQVRADHFVRDERWPDGIVRCWRCMTPWPCLLIRTLATLEAAKADVARLQGLLEEAAPWMSPPIMDEFCCAFCGSPEMRVWESIPNGVVDHEHNCDPKNHRPNCWWVRSRQALADAGAKEAP